MLNSQNDYKVFLILPHLPFLKLSDHNFLYQNFIVKEIKKNLISPHHYNFTPSKIAQCFVEYRENYQNYKNFIIRVVYGQPLSIASIFYMNC